MYFVFLCRFFELLCIMDRLVFPRGGALPFSQSMFCLLVFLRSMGRLSVSDSCQHDVGLVDETRCVMLDRLLLTQLSLCGVRGLTHSWGP